MATQFTIDDAFVLEGDEEGVVTDGEPQGWKDREGGEMTFGPLSFSKPQNHPSPAAAASPEPTNLKYQVACTQEIQNIVCISVFMLLLHRETV